MFSVISLTGYEINVKAVVKFERTHTQQSILLTKFNNIDY